MYSLQQFMSNQCHVIFKLYQVGRLKCCEQGYQSPYHLQHLWRQFSSHLNNVLAQEHFIFKIWKQHLHRVFLHLSCLTYSERVRKKHFCLLVLVISRAKTTRNKTRHSAMIYPNTQSEKNTTSFPGKRLPYSNIGACCLCVVEEN